MPLGPGAARPNPWLRAGPNPTRPLRGQRQPLSGAPRRRRPTGGPEEAHPPPGPCAKCAPLP
eukprot:9288201-Alexandrium_andersonii.AAC.1